MSRKELRRAMAPAGWTMLIYFLLLSVCTVIGIFADVVIGAVRLAMTNNIDRIDEVVEHAIQSPVGYFLAAAIGFLILLLWKKPRYIKEEIWAKERTMTCVDFLGIFCLFFSAQLVYQIIAMGTELVANTMGYTMTEGVQLISAGNGGLGMFLYVGILAPVTEEILCRGLIQRMLMPFGKRLAILGSAYLFALLHGNIFQTPYAFLVGLILGYVAAEYSISWAILLHVLNNLVLGEIFARVTADMDMMVASLMLWAFLLACAGGAVFTLIRNRRSIDTWFRENPLYPIFAKAFFNNAGVIIFTILMIISMIGTCFILFTPL